MRDIKTCQAYNVALLLQHTTLWIKKLRPLRLHEKWALLTKSPGGLV